jgi:hypothetical protein
MENSEENVDSLEERKRFLSRKIFYFLIANLTADVVLAAFKNKNYNPGVWREENITDEFIDLLIKVAKST